MDNLHQLRKFYELKKVERANSVGSRKESPAEHSWSCLILADYFLSKMERERENKLDRLKIYELLMYHDVVEIEAGDVNLLNEQTKTQIKKGERSGTRPEETSSIGIRNKIFQSFPRI